MKHLFIINPAAGSRDRTKEYTGKIEAACKPKGIEYEIAVSNAPGNCYRIARKAAESGEEVRLYACGGDGTLNEVGAGAAGFPNAAVTAFAGGSGNDFVKLFNDPSAFSDLEKLLDCEEVSFDLIRCNEDISLNICSVGLDARVGIDVSRYKRLPLLGGFRAYAASAVINIIKRIAEHYVVEINGEVLDSKQTLICACNGRFYGGGFNPVPDADPCDGMLDVLVIQKISRLRVPGVIGTYKNGGYKKLPKLIKHYRTKELTIRCDQPTSINLDGEQRISDTVNIRIADEKLRFFYPKGLVWQAAAPVTV